MWDTLYVSMYLCMFVCLYVCVYVCIYVCVHVAGWTKQTRAEPRQTCAKSIFLYSFFKLLVATFDSFPFLKHLYIVWKNDLKWLVTQKFEFFWRVYPISTILFCWFITCTVKRPSLRLFRFNNDQIVPFCIKNPQYLSKICKKGQIDQF